ncbi:MAG: hypothetical protein HN350_10710 [Phycisphaerales bacterium]|nr:hypothetical protein [Phycisphaerales bacterium]
MKRMELLICGLVLMLVSLSAVAQDAAPAAPATPATPSSPEEIETRLNALKKERQAVRDKIYAIRSRISKTDAVADLRKTYAAADKAYQEKKENDKEIAAAKIADKKAYAELKMLLNEKVKASPAGAALLKEIADLEEKEAAFDLQAAVAELKLEHRSSPVRRALNADPILKEFYDAYISAKSGKARDTARADYIKMKKTALEKIPLARELMDEIKTAKKAEDDAENAIRDAERKLDKLYQAAAESDDQDVTVVKAKCETARKAYQQAYYGGEMQSVRDARTAAQKALYEKVKQLAATDPVAVALQAQSDTLDKEYYALQEKARQLRKAKTRE